MTTRLPSAFESRQLRRGNIARAVREMLGWDLKQAGQRSGLGGGKVGHFETVVCRCLPDYATPLGEAYALAGAGWGASSVHLTSGAASDRCAIRAMLALIPMSAPTLARDVERTTGIREREIRLYLSRFGPSPSCDVVEACMSQLIVRTDWRCQFKAGCQGGWTMVGLLRECSQ